MLLEGLHIPLTTPFHADGRLNPYKLAVNVARYSKSPAASLVALAPHSGEPTLLDDGETREVFRTVAEAAAPEKVLLANISRDSVRATLALAEHADDLAYDAVLVGRPGIFCATEAGELLNYFRTVADRSPLPIVLLSMGRADAALDLKLTAQLTTHSNIVGLYIAEQDDVACSSGSQISGIGQLLSGVTGRKREVTVTSTFAAVTGRMLRAAGTPVSVQSTLVSAASLARNPAAAATAVAPPPSAPLLQTRKKAVEFQIIAASSKNLVATLNSGAVGIAPAFAACAPQACYEVLAAWKDADETLALEKQDRIVEPARLAALLGPGGLKFACDLNGYFGGLPRLPYLAPSFAQRAQLQRAMILTHT